MGSDGDWGLAGCGWVRFGWSCCGDEFADWRPAPGNKCRDGRVLTPRTDVFTKSRTNAKSHRETGFGSRKRGADEKSVFRDALRSTRSPKALQRELVLGVEPQKVLRQRLATEIAREYVVHENETQYDVAARHDAHFILVNLTRFQTT